MKKYLLVLIILFIFPAISLASSSFPQFPMAFYGSATLNGASAPAGTIIRAYYGNTLAGQSTVDSSGTYGDNSSTGQKLLVGEGAGLIVFDFVNNANPTLLNCGGEWNPVSFTSGLTVEENLAFYTSGCGGGHGGGGGIVLAASPAAGTFNSAQNITLIADGSSSVRYTTDGSIPTCSTGTVYSSVIPVGTSQTIKAIACYGENFSDVTSFTYIININTGGGGGGGGGGSSYTPPTIPPIFPIIPVVSPTLVIPGCDNRTTGFSIATGQSCTGNSASTSTTPIIIPGCNGTTGFSVTTGQSCFGNTGTFNIPKNGQVLGAQSFHFTLTLKKGSKGNEVTELQKFLNNAGYNVGTPDGQFGAKTKATVIKFQTANKLIGDGIVGAKVRILLNK